MEHGSVDLKSNKLFPFHFQLLGVIFLFFGVLFIFYSPYFIPVFLLLGGAILTGYRGVEFGRSTKVFREYNSFFFMKFGKWEKFDSVEKIFINSANVSQEIYTMVTTGITARNVEYNAYLKFGNGSKIHLASKKDKQALEDKLTEIGNLFQLEIIDNTVNQR